MTVNIKIAVGTSLNSLNSCGQQWSYTVGLIMMALGLMFIIAVDTSLNSGNSVKIKIIMGTILSSENWVSILNSYWTLV